MSSFSFLNLYLVLSAIVGVGLCDLNDAVLKSLQANDWKDGETIEIQFGWRAYALIFLMLCAFQIFVLYRSQLLADLHCWRGSLERAQSVKIMLQKSFNDMEDLSDSTQSEFEYRETSDSETSESNSHLFPDELL